MPSELPLPTSYLALFGFLRIVAAIRTFSLIAIFGFFVLSFYKAALVTYLTITFLLIVIGFIVILSLTTKAHMNPFTAPLILPYVKQRRLRPFFGGAIATIAISATWPISISIYIFLLNRSIVNYTAHNLLASLPSATISKFPISIVVPFSFAILFLFLGAGFPADVKTSFLFRAAVLTQILGFGAYLLSLLGDGGYHSNFFNSSFIKPFFVFVFSFLLSTYAASGLHLLFQQAFSVDGRAPYSADIFDSAFRIFLGSGILDLLSLNTVIRSLAAATEQYPSIEQLIKAVISSAKEIRLISLLEVFFGVTLFLAFGRWIWHALFFRFNDRQLTERAGARLRAENFEGARKDASKIKDISLRAEIELILAIYGRDYKGFLFYLDKLPRSHYAYIFGNIPHTSERLGLEHAVLHFPVPLEALLTMCEEHWEKHRNRADAWILYSLLATLRPAYTEHKERILQEFSFMRESYEFYKIVWNAANDEGPALLDVIEKFAKDDFSMLCMAPTYLVEKALQFDGDKDYYRPTIDLYFKVARHLIEEKKTKFDIDLVSQFYLALKTCHYVYAQGFGEANMDIGRVLYLAEQELHRNAIVFPEAFGKFLERPIVF